MKISRVQDILPEAAQREWALADALDHMFYAIATAMHPEVNPVTIEDHGYYVVYCVRAAIKAARDVRR